MRLDEFCSEEKSLGFTIILYPGRYLRCSCGGLPRKKPESEAFFGKHLFQEGLHVDGGAGLCLSQRVHGEGCMKMLSLTSGWCNATCSSGWKLLAACCPSLRWDVALLGAVHSVRAAGPGCSSLLPEPCPWAARGEERSRQGWERKHQAVAHRILSEVFKE